MARELSRVEVRERVDALLAGLDPAVEHLRLRLYARSFSFNLLDTEPSAEDVPTLHLRVELYGNHGASIGKVELGPAHEVDVLPQLLRFAEHQPLSVSLYREEHPLDSWMGARPLLHASGPQSEAQCAALLEARGYEVQRGERSLRVYRELRSPPRVWHLVFLPLYLFLAPLGMLLGISPLRTLRSFFRSALTGKRVYVEVGLADGKVWSRLGEDGDKYDGKQVAASDILALHFTPGRDNEPFRVPGTLYCLLRDRRVELSHMLPEVGYSQLSARPFYEEGLALRELLACALIRARSLDPSNSKTGS